MSEVNPKLLAEFVEEALAGLGVSDDADELIGYAYDESGEENARELMERYNNAITFLNQHVGYNHRLITEEDFQRWTES